MKKYIVIFIAILLIPWINGFGNKPIKHVKNVNGEKILISSSLNLPPAKKSESLRYPANGIFLTLVPSSTSIANSNIKSDDTWEAKGGFGFNFEVGYYAKLSKLIGYGIGLGYSSFKSDLTLNVNYAEVSSVDIDGDNYLRKIAPNNVVEKLNVSYLDIPIFIEVGNPNIDKIGFYGRLGVKISFPLSANFKPSGIATYHGYYDSLNVELSDINLFHIYGDKFNFPSNANIYIDYSSKLNSVNVSAIVSAGVTFPLSNYFILRAGANANIGLLEISNQKADNYENTKYDGNYSKVLENPNKTTTRSFGVEIGLIYNLRLY